jgi:hypothetical protein
MQYKMHRTYAGELQSVRTGYGYTVLSQRSLSSWEVLAGSVTPADFHLDVYDETPVFSAAQGAAEFARRGGFLWSHR